MKSYILSICALLLLTFVSSATSQTRSGSKAIPYGSNEGAGRSIPIDGAQIYFECMERVPRLYCSMAMAGISPT